MVAEKTIIQDLLVITPTVFEDERGYFFESYNESLFEKNGINIKFIQDNQSFSKQGVIRGLHLQLPPFAQTKLVRVLEGEILDVAVDIRKNSKTYGKYFSIRLSSENKKQLFIPKGFAHGFSALSSTAVVSYKVDQIYDKASERGIRFDEPELNIDWEINCKNCIVSVKDLILGSLKDLDSL